MIMNMMIVLYYRMYSSVLQTECIKNNRYCILVQPDTVRPKWIQDII